MAGRSEDKLKGFATVWYGIALVIGIIGALAAVIYWSYLLLTDQKEIDWGVVVLLSFVGSIIVIAVLFLPRFRERKD